MSTHLFFPICSQLQSFQGSAEHHHQQTSLEEWFPSQAKMERRRVLKQCLICSTIFQTALL